VEHYKLPRAKSLAPRGFFYRVVCRLLRTSNGPRARLPVASVVGQKSPFYNTKRLIIGGSDLGPLEFAVLPLELPSDFEGMLGYYVYAEHVVCLNYGRSELRVR
jgi:hypothetical protein